MFTNMPINEILPAVRKAYDTFDKSDFKVKCPPADDLIYLLRSVLENNVFEFDGKLFIQKIGVAIGAVPSPECCSILMFQIMKDIFFQNLKNTILFTSTEDIVMMDFSYIMGMKMKLKHFLQ
jgi:hypothetical protein